MSAAPQRLYIYYRVAAGEVDAVLDAARQALVGLTAACPALQCELLRRPGQRDGQVTLMEVHAAPRIDEMLARQIEDHMQRHLAPWLDGAQRHVEAFDLSAGVRRPG